MSKATSRRSCRSSNPWIKRWQVKPHFSRGGQDKYQGKSKLQLTFSRPAGEAELQFQEAEELRESGDHAAAIKAYREAIKLKDGIYPAARAGLARSLMASEEYEEAVTEARRVNIITASFPKRTPSSPIRCVRKVSTMTRSPVTARRSLKRAISRPKLTPAWRSPTKTSIAPMMPSNTFTSRLSKAALPSR
jgi:tetratricopeptide (TPR) repeat protein